MIGIKLLHTSLGSFKQGDPVWLSVPTAGKLDARYEKNGEVGLCINYREINKRTVKDAYPLPRQTRFRTR